MAVPQNARMGCTMLGELVKWYEFAGKKRGNQILPRNGHNRSLHESLQKSGRTENLVRPLYFGHPPVEGKKARKSWKE